jgi:hypothetical protein
VPRLERSLGRREIPRTRTVSQRSATHNRKSHEFGRLSCADPPYTGNSRLVPALGSKAPPASPGDEPLDGDPAPNVSERCPKNEHKSVMCRLILNEQARSRQRAPNVSQRQRSPGPRVANRPRSMLAMNLIDSKPSAGFVPQFRPWSVSTWRLARNR